MQGVVLTLTVYFEYLQNTLFISLQGDLSTIGLYKGYDKEISIFLTRSIMVQYLFLSNILHKAATAIEIIKVT